MQNQEKVLQLNPNLSKLIDSLCFQLSVNTPDESSLSLLEIIQWRKCQEISQEEFKQLYNGWLESKNVFDLFTTRQLQTYPKEQLLEFEGPIKALLNVKEITKLLEILNTVYNEIYIEKRLKGSESVKAQIKAIEEVQQLFSYLDHEGVINLRMSQLFFLAGGLTIAEGKPTPDDFQLFKEGFLRVLSDLNEINGHLSLRAFKNYFLVHKKKPTLIKTLTTILTQIQTLSQIDTRQKSASLPNIFEESLQKYTSKKNEKKISFLRRFVEQNQKLFMFADEGRRLEKELVQKYGRELLGCLELDETALEEFVLVVEDTLNKYVSLFQRLSTAISKPKITKPQYITVSQQSARNLPSTLQTSIKKRKPQFQLPESATKPIHRTTAKDRTPQKKRRPNDDFLPSNNYRNRTPTHSVKTQISGIHKEFGSAQKNNRTVRQATPTKSTLSFMTDVPRTYRAAQKKGLTNNNLYDKLFFFRNKRVQSYEIVMKRLKNK